VFGTRSRVGLGFACPLVLQGELGHREAQYLHRLKSP
jgi:hypothetical protein